MEIYYLFTAGFCTAGFLGATVLPHSPRKSDRIKVTHANKKRKKKNRRSKRTLIILTHYDR
jgi:hypothetical protein